MDDKKDPTDTISVHDAAIIVAISVLRSYAAGTLETDMCDELDDALEKAYNVYIERWVSDNVDYEEPSDYEIPLTQSW